MPATLVWRTSTSGALQQVQVGASGLVATYGAAQSAWGWLGGLAGVQRLLNTLKNGYEQDPFSSLHLKSINIPDSVCHILTTSGMLFLQEADGRSEFGGDPVTQAIGLTICALEHECSGAIAVDLFVRFIATSFTEGHQAVPGLAECLHQQLVDHLPAIIGEGASRGLPERFVDVAASLPQATRKWHFSPELLLNRLDSPQNFELSLLGGLLLWLSHPRSTDPYYTRSSLAARNAAYLRSVGYDIGPICVWDGQGQPPEPRPRGVVLVVGGTSETDHEHSDFSRVFGGNGSSNDKLKSYFRQDTTGSMLVNSLGIPTEIAPESVQEIFLSVQSTINMSLSNSWEVKPASTPHASSTWQMDDKDGMTLYNIFQVRKPSQKASSTCIRLASVYFPLSAEMVAQCYARIMNDSILISVQEGKLNDLELMGSIDLMWFRIVTASIILAIGERLATAGFRELSHVTQMYLGSPNWLEAVTGRLDKSLKSGIPYYDAAIIIGSIHSAAPTDLLGLETVQRSTILGFRRGRHAVIPALLATMSVSLAGTGITCFDKFIANVPIFPDGTVRAEDMTGTMWSPPEKKQPDTSWQQLDKPVDSAADIAIYLGIERALLSTTPKIVLSARLKGTPVGSASIRKVMWVMTKSAKMRESCQGHNDEESAIMLRPSTWTILGQDRWDRFDSNLSKSHHMFLPVLGDNSWVMLIVGSAPEPEKVAISFGCFSCAAAVIKNPKAAICNMWLWRF
ncbi:hypothetical protein VTL71DRAFT_13382 [Oculimacula yallundae]|uniref:Uncharacterized protein n=1 Tax=Oculimacula yallundae TaxID=86028 RepID=A0ABR4CLP2_9HELO